MESVIFTHEQAFENRRKSGEQTKKIRQTGKTEKKEGEAWNITLRCTPPEPFIHLVSKSLTVSSFTSILIQNGM